MRPQSAQLNTFDGRPVYRFSSDTGEYVVYADTGEEQLEVSEAMVRRIAEAWTKQPVSSARVEAVTDVDQWTVQMRIADLRPLWKFTWPDGEQVYVTQTTGDVVQHTTTGLAPRRVRRRHSPLAVFHAAPQERPAVEPRRHLVVRHRHVRGDSRRDHRRVDVFAVEAVPIRGRAEQHPVSRAEALAHGARADLRRRDGNMGVQRDAVDGSLPDARDGRRPAAPRRRPADDSAGAARTACSSRRSRRRTRARRSGSSETCTVKELEFTSFAGEPIYLATLARRRHADRSGRAASRSPRSITSESSTSSTPPPDPGWSRRACSTQYDRYYLDRRRQRPLPVILAQLHDEEHTRYYIDPKTARVVGSYNSQRMGQPLAVQRPALARISRGCTTTVRCGTSW